MRDYEEELEKMQNMVAALQKELTMNKGEKVEPDQDGNRGASMEVTGEVDYSNFIPIYHTNFPIIPLFYR